MKNTNYIINPQRVQFWITISFIIGITLRAIHYIGRSSMWFDELTSALNIRDKSFYQLMTTSLDYNQVAPVGFLLEQKLAITLFGVNDHAYRLFPFLFSIVSMFLFLSIAKQFLKGSVLIASFLLFATSVATWFYGGEAKQYSGDITAALFLVWAALQLLNSEVKQSTIGFIAGAGFIMILSSLPAVVIAPAVLLIVFIRLVKKQINLSLQSFFIIAFCWALACAATAYHAKFVISPTVQNDMGNYWSRGFADSSSISAYITWLYKTVSQEFSFFLSFWMKMTVSNIHYVSGSLLLLSVPGIIFLAKKYSWQLLVLFASFLVAILLATAKVLPFDSRVAVYATWPFIISGMAGIYALGKWILFLSKPVLQTTMSFIIALPILFFTIIKPTEHPPFQAQATQPVLHELKKQLQPGDKLFVYFKARHALNFYGAAEGITDYKVGGDYKNIEEHLRQLDSLRGNKRVWFFFSQWTERQPFPDSIKAYLGNVIGKEIGKIPDPYGLDEDVEAAAHLYDLTQPSK